MNRWLGGLGKSSEEGKVEWYGVAKRNVRIIENIWKEDNVKKGWAEDAELGTTKRGTV